MLLMKLILTLLMLSSLPATAATNYLSACASCHGKKGEGNATLQAPSIASLPTWYTRPQIKNIKSQLRPAQTNDVQMLAMKKIITSMSDDTISSITDEIAALARIPTTNTLKGNAERGAKLYEWHCIQCHRYNASGEKVFGSPPLTGLQDWYMLEQLKRFKDQRRGVDADDSGYKMHQVVQRIEDEQSLIDILAYVATLAAAEK